MTKEQACRKCGLVQPLSNYRRSASSKGGYYKTCKACTYSQATSNKEKLTFSYWKHKLKKAYSLTPDDYYLMLQRQGGVCAICGTSNPGAKKSYFCVDHCHHTGQVRGLLCSSCNIGIGNLKDSRRLLQSALLYLDGKPTSDDVLAPSTTSKRGKKTVERVDL